MQRFRAQCFAGLFIFLAALGLVLPLLLSNRPVVGIDALFHFNRFYDVAEQLKHGQFSYFMAEYGYQQSGRIVTPLYGPWLSYLMGALLVLLPNWFWFEVVTDVVVLVIAGFGIYRLVRYLDATRYASLLSAVVYMALPLTTEWQNSQAFSAIGAALLPYVIYYGIAFMKQPTTFSWIGLAVSLAVITQSHLFTSLLATLVLAIFFVISIMKQPWSVIRQLLVRLVCAIGLYAVLSANVIVGMLDVMGTNRILTPFTPADIGQKGMHVAFDRLPSLRNYSVLALWVVVIFIGSTLVYQKLQREYRVMLVLAALFFVLSLAEFPWHAVQQLMPTVVNTMQFPSRLAVVSNLALVVLLARLLSMVVITSRIRRSTKIVIAIVVVLVPVAISSSMLAKNAHRLHTTQLVKNKKHVQFNPNKTPMQIASDWRFGSLATGLQDIQKATPDYVVNHGLRASDNAYDRYMQEIINNPIHVKVKQASDRMTLTWRATTTHKATLPVIIYKHSQVTLNGRRLTQPTQSRIGAIRVVPQLGQNEIQVSYRPAGYVWPLIWLNIGGWLSIVVVIVGRSFKR